MRDSAISLLQSLDALDEAMGRFNGDVIGRDNALLSEIFDIGSNDIVENTASDIPAYRWAKTGTTTVVARHVLNDFVDDVGRNGMRSLERKFAIGLSRYMPDGFKSCVAKVPDGDGTSSAHRVYDFPSLGEARAAFGEKIGLSGWPEADLEEET